MSKKRSKRNRLARRLLSFALDELYCFEDDAIEDALDKAILKFNDETNGFSPKVSFLNLGRGIFPHQDGGVFGVNCSDLDTWGGGDRA